MKTIQFIITTTIILHSAATLQCSEKRIALAVLDPSNQGTSEQLYAQNTDGSIDFLHSSNMRHYPFSTSPDMNGHNSYSRAMSIVMTQDIIARITCAIEETINSPYNVTDKILNESRMLAGSRGTKVTIYKKEISSFSTEQLVSELQQQFKYLEIARSQFSLISERTATELNFFQRQIGWQPNQPLNICESLQGRMNPRTISTFVNYENMLPTKIIALDNVKFIVEKIEAIQELLRVHEHISNEKITKFSIAGLPYSDLATKEQSLLKEQTHLQAVAEQPQNIYISHTYYRESELSYTPEQQQRYWDTKALLHSSQLRIESINQHLQWVRNAKEAHQLSAVQSFRQSHRLEMPRIEDAFSLKLKEVSQANNSECLSEYSECYTIIPEAQALLKTYQPDYTIPDIYRGTKLQQTFYEEITQQFNITAQLAQQGYFKTDCATQQAIINALTISQEATAQHSFDQALHHRQFAQTLIEQIRQPRPISEIITQVISATGKGLITGTVEGIKAIPQTAIETLLLARKGIIAVSNLPAIIMAADKELREFSTTLAALPQYKADQLLRQNYIFAAMSALEHERAFHSSLVEAQQSLYNARTEDIAYVGSRILAQWFIGSYPRTTLIKGVQSLQKISNSTQKALTAVTAATQRMRSIPVVSALPSISSNMRFSWGAFTQPQSLHLPSLSQNALWSIMHNTKSTDAKIHTLAGIPLTSIQAYQLGRLESYLKTTFSGKQISALPWDVIRKVQDGAIIRSLEINGEMQHILKFDKEFYKHVFTLQMNASGKRFTGFHLFSKDPKVMVNLLETADSNNIIKAMVGTLKNKKTSTSCLEWNQLTYKKKALEALNNIQSFSPSTPYQGLILRGVDAENITWHIVIEPTIENLYRVKTAYPIHASDLLNHLKL